MMSSRKGDYGYTFALVLSICLIGWADAPGNMDVDAVNLYDQARLGTFSDWYTPLVVGIWYALGAKPWVLSATLIVVLVSFAFLVYQFFRKTGLNHRTACLLTILTAYTPAVLTCLGGHYRDTWTTVLFLAALCLSFAYHSRPGYMILLLRGILFGMASLIRQDFIPIAILYLVLELILFYEFPLRQRVWSLALSLLVFGITYTATDQTVRHLQRISRSYPEQCIFLFDLAAISSATDQMLIPEPFAGSNDAASIKKNYHPKDLSTLIWDLPGDQRLRFSTDPKDISNLKHQWFLAIAKYPFVYLSHRTLIFMSHLWEGQYVIPGSSSAVEKGNGIAANDFGLKSYHPGFINLFTAYLGLFRHTLIQRHFINFIGSMFLIGVILMQRPMSLPHRLVLIILACGIAYQLEFFLAIMACYYRYGYLSVVIFWISLYYIAAERVIAYYQRKGAALSIAS